MCVCVCVRIVEIGTDFFSTRMTGNHACATMQFPVWHYVILSCCVVRLAGVCVLRVG